MKIHQELDSVYGTSCLINTVCRWVRCFQIGKKDLRDKATVWSIKESHGTGESCCNRWPWYLDSNNWNLLPSTWYKSLSYQWKTRYENMCAKWVLRLNALVQSAGFSLKTQPRLLFLPISFHGLTTATVSSWVHLILSSNLSRKFRTSLQDLFSWHPGFPFQNVLSIKSLVCVSVL